MPFPVQISQGSIKTSEVIPVSTTKVRTVLRGMTGIKNSKEILNVREFGLVSLQVWSHKIMRWATPWFMLALIPVNIAIIDEGLIYQLAMLGQLLIYTTGLLGLAFPFLRKNTLIRTVFFFLQVNVATAHAFVKFTSGERMTTWKPSKR